MNVISIAIDGPAGAGKSTIAKSVAKALSFNYVDTGAMYRTVAYYCLNNHIDTKNEASVIRALKDICMEVNYVDGQQKMILNGKDITSEIRKAEVGNVASSIAVYKDVREKLVKLQQQIAKSNNVIMDGRDIGTYVLPDAKLKIYLTASATMRAKRRYDEFINKGIEANLEEIKTEIEERDRRDMTRQYAPLRKASDAIELDTTLLSIDEVADKVLDLYKELNK